MYYSELGEDIVWVELRVETAEASMARRRLADSLLL